MPFSVTQLDTLTLARRAGRGSLTHPLWLPVVQHGTGGKHPLLSHTHFEASVSYRISSNPHNNLGVDPYYLSFTTAGATSEVRGLPWVTELVPGPALCQDLRCMFSTPARWLPAPLALGGYHGEMGGPTPRSLGLNAGPRMGQRERERGMFWSHQSSRGRPRSSVSPSQENQEGRTR